MNRKANSYFLRPASIGAGLFFVERIPLIYLIHFSSPLHHAKHYLGFVEKAAGLARRLRYHRAGKGSKLLRAVAAAGIEFQVVRTWEEGTRTQERELKNHGYGPRLCPLCRPGDYIKIPKCLAGGQVPASAAK